MTGKGRLAERQRHGVGRRERDAVGSETGARGHENRRTVLDGVDELAELFGGYAWHVARHRHERACAASQRLGLGERDRGGVTAVLRLDDRLGAELEGNG